MIAVQCIHGKKGKCRHHLLSYWIFGDNLLCVIMNWSSDFVIYCQLVKTCRSDTHRRKIYTLPNVFVTQLTLLRRPWLLTTPEISDINSGYNCVSDGWNCIPDWSLKDQIEHYFHAPMHDSICHATVAVHDNSLANACLYPHLCLHPNQDPHVHDDRGTWAEKQTKDNNQNRIKIYECLRNSNVSFLWYVGT